MTKKLTILTLAVIVSLGATSFAQTYTGEVSVENVQVHPGDHFGVKVNLANNNMSFAGMSLPLSFTGNDITLDSVSFAGSIKPSNFNAMTNIDNLNNTVTITYLSPYNFSLPLETISAASGVLAELFFTVSVASGNQSISIDFIDESETVTYNSETIYKITGAHFANVDGLVTVEPEVTSGGIEVQIMTAVIDGEEGMVPTSFALNQNYPNPFNPSTTIEFSLPSASDVKLEIFNIIGQKVMTLVDGNLSAGSHSYEFDASGQPSGIYFYRLTHEKGSDTKKMVLVK
ncbi:MAG: T9SS type A sorting domain-containing protein [Candidatus Zixiibacteriota bacterium]